MTFKGRCAVIIWVACLASARDDQRLSTAGSPREKRFIAIGGDGVPEYDDTDVPYDYGVDVDNDDDDLDDDDDDLDIDGPGYHHVWWHHFYHHGEPHLPFPLFPLTFFVHRRPLHHSCDEWPFPCTTSYEVIRWLQCYYEHVAAGHRDDASSLLHVHGPWKK